MHGSQNCRAAQVPSHLLDLERQALQQVGLVLGLPQLPELCLKPVLHVPTRCTVRGKPQYPKRARILCRVPCLCMRACRAR